MAFLIISTQDNSVLAGPMEELPEEMPADSRSVVAPLSFGVDMIWSPEADGFVSAVPQSAVITVGRFKLLFTGAERIGFRSAATSDPEVADALDLLNGFTTGLSLDDPVLAGFLIQMAAKGLLAPDRIDVILAGQSPA